MGNQHSRTSSADFGKGSMKSSASNFASVRNFSSFTYSDTRLTADDTDGKCEQEKLGAAMATQKRIQRRARPKDSDDDEDYKYDANDPTKQPNPPYKAKRNGHSSRKSGEQKENEPESKDPDRSKNNNRTARGDKDPEESSAKIGQRSLLTTPSGTSGLRRDSAGRFPLVPQHSSEDRMTEYTDVCSIMANNNCKVTQGESDDADVSDDESTEYSAGQRRKSSFGIPSLPRAYPSSSSYSLSSGKSPLAAVEPNGARSDRNNLNEIPIGASSRAVTPTSPGQEPKEHSRTKEAKELAERNLVLEAHLSQDKLLVEVASEQDSRLGEQGDKKACQDDNKSTQAQSSSLNPTFKRPNMLKSLSVQPSFESHMDHLNKIFPNLRSSSCDNRGQQVPIPSLGTAAANKLKNINNLHTSTSIHSNNSSMASPPSFICSVDYADSPLVSPMGPDPGEDQRPSGGRDQVDEFAQFVNASIHPPNELSVPRCYPEPGAALPKHGVRRQRYNRSKSVGGGWISSSSGSSFPSSPRTLHPQKSVGSSAPGGSRPSSPRPRLQRESAQDLADENDYFADVTSPTGDQPRLQPRYSNTLYPPGGAPPASPHHLHPHHHYHYQQYSRLLSPGGGGAAGGVGNAGGGGAAQQQQQLSLQVVAGAGMGSAAGSFSPTANPGAGGVRVPQSSRGRHLTSSASLSASRPPLQRSAPGTPSGSYLDNLRRARSRSPSRTPSDETTMDSNTGTHSSGTYLRVPFVRTRGSSLPENMEDTISNNLCLLRQFNIKGRKVVHVGDTVCQKRTPLGSNSSVNTGYSGGVSGEISRYSSISRSASERSNNTSLDEDGASGQLGSQPPPQPPVKQASVSKPQHHSLDDLETQIPSHRVIMLGSSGVGKTSLVKKFLTANYNNTFDTTQEVFFKGQYNVRVLLDGVECELVFIDKPGVSPEGMITSYDGDCALVVFSVTDISSLQEAEEILDKLLKPGSLSSTSRAVIVVGNKTDLVRTRTVPIDVARSIATTHDCKYCEVSVALDHNVDSLLVGIVKQIRLKMQNECMRGRGSTRGRRKSAGAKMRGLIEKVLGSETTISKSCDNLYVL